MKTSLNVLGFIMLALSSDAFAEPAIYCPGNHGYITIGMTQSQVINACGNPTIVQTAEARPILRKIPVMQLVYSTLNSGSVYPGLNDAFYNQWSLASGATGNTVRIDIINNRIANMALNGSSTPTLTVCGDRSLELGDDVNNVYNTCGTPSMVNHTFITRPVPPQLHPEIWTYQISPYQPVITLTFVNGQLESIN